MIDRQKGKELSAGSIGYTTRSLALKSWHAGSTSAWTAQVLAKRMVGEVGFFAAVAAEAHQSEAEVGVRGDKRV